MTEQEEEIVGSSGLLWTLDNKAGDAAGSSGHVGTLDNKA